MLWTRQAEPRSPDQQGASKKNGGCWKQVMPIRMNAQIDLSNMHMSQNEVPYFGSKRALNKGQKGTSFSTSPYIFEKNMGASRCSACLQAVIVNHIDLGNLRLGNSHDVEVPGTTIQPHQNNSRYGFFSDPNSSGSCWKWWCAVLHYLSEWPKFELFGCIVSNQFRFGLAL